MLTLTQIRTLLAKNSVVTLPPDSRYRGFLPSITKVDQYVDTGKCPSARELADAVVHRALKIRPPKYFSMGKDSTITWIVSWLPRSLTLWIVRRKFSE